MEDFQNLETVPTANEELQQAAPIVAELAANPEVVAALADQGFEIDAGAVQNVNNTSLATPLVEVPAVIVDPSTGFFGVYVEPTIEKIEQAVVEEVEEVVAFVETEAKEGYVAAENLVRKVLNHHISAGGGSIIKNPG